MKRVAAVLLAQLVALLGAGGAALAGPADSQRFLVVGRIEAPSVTIVATGVIVGAGSLTAESVDFRPTGKTYDETDLAVFGAGTLTMSVHGEFDAWPFTLDPRSCTQRGSLAGTWSVTRGSGGFAGATGGGTFSGRFFTYARRGPAGCDSSAIKGLVAGPMAGSLSLGAG